MSCREELEQCKFVLLFTMPHLHGCFTAICPLFGLLLGESVCLSALNYYVYCTLKSGIKIIHLKSLVLTLKGINLKWNHVTLCPVSYLQAGKKGIILYLCSFIYFGFSYVLVCRGAIQQPN